MRVCMFAEPDIWPYEEHGKAKRARAETNKTPTIMILKSVNDVL